MIIQYNHHGMDVWTNEKTKGKHRAHCLCYSCELFKPISKDNCEIAQEVFELCTTRHLVLPVFECPLFKGAKCPQCGDVMVTHPEYLLPFCNSWNFMEGGCLPAPRSK